MHTETRGGVFARTQLKIVSRLPLFRSTMAENVVGEKLCSYSRGPGGSGYPWELDQESLQVPLRSYRPVRASLRPARGLFMLLPAAVVDWVARILNRNT